MNTTDTATAILRDYLDHFTAACKATGFDLAAIDEKAPLVPQVIGVCRVAGLGIPQFILVRKLQMAGGIEAIADPVTELLAIAPRSVGEQWTRENERLRKRVRAICRELEPLADRVQTYGIGTLTAAERQRVDELEAEGTRIQEEREALTAATLERLRLKPRTLN